jgi:hypothetical protein
MEPKARSVVLVWSAKGVEGVKVAGGRSGSGWVGEEKWAVVKDEDEDSDDAMDLGIGNGGM